MAEETVPQKQNRFLPLVLTAVIIVLVGVVAWGIRWIFSLSSGAIGSVPFLLFDYAVGLTMIFLPCTLPLAFVIVPLVVGKSYRKGIGMALAFGLGVAITLSVYGLLIGALGQALGVSKVETAKNILYALAGALALAFALGELGLIRFRSPSLDLAVPQFILRQKDIFKAGLMGLFLGNVGVGCPNPLFNAVIIPQIVALGSPIQGGIIMLVQALGRITPLLILAFLGILGVNATKFLVKHKDAVAHGTGWATVFVAGFLLMLGLFGHDGWVVTGQHTVFEMITQEELVTKLLSRKLGELGQLGHEHTVPTGVGLFGQPLAWSTPVLLFVWIFPFFWYWFRKKKGLGAMAAEVQATEKRLVGLMGWFFVTLAVLLIVVFGWILPHQFAAHWSQEPEVEMIAPDFHAEFKSFPGPAQAGRPFDLLVLLHDSKGSSLTDLQISHQRILHVVMVSEDLEEFKHVHPEDAGPISRESIAKGEFQIPLILNTPGRYRVLVDAFRGGREVSDVEWFSVAGPERRVTITKDLRRTRLFQGYQVTLNVDPSEPRSGQEVELIYQIRKDGKLVLDTEPYLGADMHLALMPVDLSVMIHIHGAKVMPEEGGRLLPAARAHGPSGGIEAHQVFPFAGLWKIYGQFQDKGKVVTTEFMIEVFPGEESELMPHID